MAYTSLCADPEEERRSVFSLEDILLREIGDVRDKRFLRRR